MRFYERVMILDQINIFKYSIRIFDTSNTTTGFLVNTIGTQ